MSDCIRFQLLIVSWLKIHRMFFYLYFHLSFVLFLCVCVMQPNQIGFWLHLSQLYMQFHLVTSNKCELQANRILSQTCNFRTQTEMDLEKCFNYRFRDDKLFQGYQLFHSSVFQVFCQRIYMSTTILIFNTFFFPFSSLSCCCLYIPWYYVFFSGDQKSLKENHIYLIMHVCVCACVCVLVVQSC